MNREELANVIAAVLGLHATEGRVNTILFAADAYASRQTAYAASQIAQTLKPEVVPVMRNPFRRRNPQLEDPNGRVFMSADEMFAALDAETAKPKRGPAMHFRPADWTMNAATGPTTACGKYVAVAWVTSVPGDVGCLGCQRTVIYRTRISPAAIPAAGTTRKQES